MLQDMLTSSVMLLLRESSADGARARLLPLRSCADAACCSSARARLASAPSTPDVASTQHAHT